MAKSASGDIIDSKDGDGCTNNNGDGDGDGIRRTSRNNEAVSFAFDKVESLDSFESFLGFLKSQVVMVAKTIEPLDTNPAPVTDIVRDEIENV